MAIYSRTFFLSISKNIFFLTFLFLLPLLSCGFKKPAIIHSENSTIEMKESAFRSMGENDIFSALALIEVQTREDFYPVKAALVVKRPSYLRMELLSLIGVPDFLLTVSPEAMKIFIPSKQEFYSGRPTVSNLEKFLPWAIDIEDMVMILTGTYPFLKEKHISYQTRLENNLLRVEMNAPSGASQIIWLGENNKLLRMIRKDDTGEELYNVKYTYNDVRSDFPEKIIINSADETTLLSVKYSDVKIEKSNDLSVFDLAVPVDVKEIILE
jgi:hypothetical protein